MLLSWQRYLTAGILVTHRANWVTRPIILIARVNFTWSEVFNNMNNIKTFRKIENRAEILTTYVADLRGICCPTGR